jgi:hypothetical protein
MATTVKMEWHGDARMMDLLEAMRWGIDSMMADCIKTAKGLVPRRTTILQGSIQMRPSVIQGVQVTGHWGSYAVNYAWYVEAGTRPHMIFPRVKKALYWKGAAHPVPWVSHPGTAARPYLQPAADQHYPSLPLRVRAKLAWGSEP